ncbi:MAG: GDSL family lipase [Runella slithyformis]|nr:MAG: GDSL family lipase [Runella slithyformis]TAF96210.1 MAG: GDSL family lipase [Runella sp.]TAG18817.1 MAG: GDSL family lipase [Cytophagales bacterium]TAG39362.1 MAG: GDSL family lipase [Cytophagia bacterium]TAF25905.1 MAG: GDSL family lipase [Runella slithyformis]
MQKKKSSAIGSLILWFTTFILNAVVAQNQAKTTFEIKDNERVVFLGNSLFENELQHGYLELALTTRWPNRNVTFRNLGWTGDNVWGEARSTFTNPPTPYQHLMQQITQAKPTLVFVAYGGVEAQDGPAGLPRFKEGFNKLLDKIDSLGAKAILLSPIPVWYEDTAANVVKRNADIELYASAIAKIATERGKQFIDIYKPIQAIENKAAILENGVHLNELGHYFLATELQKNLGLLPQPSPVAIALSKNAPITSSTAKMLGISAGNAILKFTIDANFLQLPLPDANNSLVNNTQTIQITGLKKGIYNLMANNEVIVAASEKKWAEGLAITQGPAFEQSRQLQEMIIKKNEQFFFQYRPLNRTYILGFRSYEQGRHAKGLEEQSLIIKWLEGQINLNSRPKSIVYQLVLVK